MYNVNNQKHYNPYAENTFFFYLVDITFTAMLQVIEKELERVSPTCNTQVQCFLSSIVKLTPNSLVA